jgi:hypothetical protein
MRTTNGCPPVTRSSSRQSQAGVDQGRRSERAGDRSPAISARVGLTETGGDIELGDAFRHPGRSWHWPLNASTVRSLRPRPGTWSRLRMSARRLVLALVLVIGLPASAAAQGVSDPSRRPDAGASSEVRPERADSAEVTALEEQIARDDAMLSTDSCAVACQALASMQRSVDRLCALEPGPMCVKARAKVKDADGRVRASCPECGRAGGEAPLADARRPESAPTAAPPQRGRGCAGCTIGADERGSTGAIALALAWALARSIRRRGRRAR